ncbi:MAG: hypothetical protein N4A40_06025, partial [Tissierellales bacterium]|nr:hypothetical protein [Tissierellales bacterium]
MSMKRQSIRHKFFIFFIVVSILSVVLAMEYSYSSTSQREYNEYVSLAIRMDGMIDQMRIKYFLDRIESFSDREYLESSQKLINTAESEILNRYTEELHEQFGESIVAKVEELEQDFNFIKNLFQNELYRDDTVDEIQMYFDALDDSNTEVKKEIIIEIRELIDKTQIIIDWTLFLLIFVCVVFIATLNKEIMKPLKWMTKQLEKQSEIDGKFYEPISIDVKNEMGYFINAYNQLAKTNLAMHQLNEKIYAQNSFDEIM